MLFFIFILFSSPGIEPGTSGYLPFINLYQLQTDALPTELQRVYKYFL